MTSPKAAAPLPIPLAEARALPALAPAARLAADLRQFEQYIDRADLPALRAAGPAASALARRFAEVDRPATADDIATAAVIATTTMPMANGMDPAGVAHVLCEDLAEKGVTAFELQEALRELRWTETFFGFPALARELGKARKLAHRYRRGLNVDRRIAQVERYQSQQKEAEDRRGRLRAELDAFDEEDGA